jgi:iron complex outermembrane receptor protein
MINKNWKLPLPPAAAFAALAIWTTSVNAQEAPKPDAGEDDLAEVLVTGSRIISSGFTAPTPTTTLSASELQKAAQPNLFDAVAQLPSLQGSFSRAVNVNSTSSGLQGLSSFSLRGLGAIRTLTLLDGQRVMPANVTGITDVSQFPQLLVKRIDVVTGGASASYGSDAIGGVVSFATDKRFEGVRANLEAGISTYGDDENITGQIAWGGAFLDDRLHIVASAEYGKEEGIPAYGFGVGHGPNGRDWYNSPAFQVRPLAQTNDGLPQYRVIEGAQLFQYSKYGLITSGPLQGIAFGENGAPYQFQYGSNGVPTGTGAVTDCITPFCVGGDLSGVVGNGTSLVAELQRKVGYTRIGFDLSDNHEIYFSVNLAETNAVNTPNPGAAKNGNLTIQCENPYLPQSIRDACVTNGITSFAYGVTNAIFPKWINVHPNRKQQRYVLGADGKFDIGGAEWQYNAYYQNGTNDTDLYVHDISLTPRYNAAIDAIAGPNGTVICRSAAARASGCSPLNIIGNVTPSAAAIEYVLPTQGPEQHSHQTQDVVSFNISGDPFNSWAGPVSIATGLEYREEAYDVYGDPYGAGVTDVSPNSADYPADPLMNTDVGNNWYAGNYHNADGKYDVKEGYVEFNVPLLDSEGGGKINFNAAYRHTDYSTSGGVNTWKLGGTWKMPWSGLMLRAVTSRDVRAPNLSELFAAQITRNNTVNVNNTTITIQERTIGNTELRPEVARNTEIGLVLSQPDWLPGFSASFDWFDITVDDVISSLSAQQEVDLCLAGNQELCAAMLLTSTVPNTNYVQVQAFNLASNDIQGFDIELQYRAQNGFSIRALGTHNKSFVSTPGVVGTIPSQLAGANLGSVPKWKGLVTESWEGEKLSLSLTQRYISSGVYNNEWIECQTGCPVATPQHPTIDDNHMAGAFYLDFGANYKFGGKAMAYLKIDNVLNKDPAPAPQTNVGYGANPFLYDILGRMYRAGVRYNF